MRFVKNDGWHKINLPIWMPEIISAYAALDYRQIGHGWWEKFKKKARSVSEPYAFISSIPILPDGSYVMGGELAFPDFGVAIIGKDHGSDPVRDDPRLFQLFMIFSNMI